MLKINQLSKQFESHQALRDISFEITKGTITGLLGHNGAGKTTLIRILVGIFESDSGSLLWDNEKVVPEVIQKKIGYLPEERGLYKGMKVFEYLNYISKLRGLSKTKRAEVIQDWLQKLGLEDWKENEIGELSKGMQQKVQFIATVMHEPDFLILDEPFSGFDPVNEQHIIDEILALKVSGTTILFSTHRMDSVEELCDDLVFLNKGELIYNGGVKDLLSSYESDDFELLTKEGRQLLSSDKLKSGLKMIDIKELTSISRKKKSLKDIFIEKVNENK